MPTAEYRVYLDNEAADEETLGYFGEIRVDQAIGMATEAELHLDLTVDDEGYWDLMEEGFAQPGARVRIEVKVAEEDAEGDYVPLIEGTIVGQRFELSAEPESSEMVLVVQDDSLLLNQDETVELFEDKRADEIAEQLFDDFGLDAEVDDMPDAGSALPRFTVQRGTAMELLKELARNHGAHVYVKPGEEPGSSVGVFAYPSWDPSELPELLLLGEERNVASFRAEFDATRPLVATAYSVTAADKSIIGSTLDTPDVETLGDEGAHDVVTAAHTLLASAREEQSDLDEAVFAAVNVSSFAYSASGEVSADTYEGVLLPYHIVTVVGAGPVLSGDYLISRVTHTLSDEGYTQQFELKRNARSGGGGAGGLLGGIL